ncbi:uncharacterized protein LOC119006032 isoform X2 [Acanthopagrus latus]|nr:uncharacterized protein LOC119006032 isoform X2 [Acanthopagrus latus]XP_036930247.1 uncharacterized protein LOC119006032 isoform X2 [Acanthopagrus latus]XP_036930248.1 uncharacterized protein LOC119006032 isoform X2 [Acanthopagrus latus]
MNSLISVAVILQLVITGIKTDGQYQFGDIIEFPRYCMEGMPIYSHFAVYVGPESGVNVGQGDNDIFHRTDWKGKEYVCEFDKLNETIWNSVDKEKNYLDFEVPAGNRTTDKIKERIKEMEKKCEKYTYLSSNCEHLVTYVRYGRRLSLQKGTHFGYILPLVNRLKNEEIEEQYEAVLKISVEALRNKTRNAENNEDLCSNDAPKPDIPTGKLSACCIALAIFCCVLSCLCVGWIVKCFIIKKSRACSQEGV